MIDHLVAATLGGVADDIGRSVRESLFMFADTFWALVLGFGLSGAVQAFVSRASMQRRLGDHGPAAVARASAYGAVSSSCSYAASAMAKSLFQKGADFVASTVFMFSSTNLVIELGVVLVVLIGWQFMAAEFVGGVVMIVLLAMLGGWFFRGRALDEARARVGTGAGDAAAAGSEGAPPVRRWTSLAGWSDAAGYALADLTMLRRELVVGYGVAGFLAVLVPVHVWNDAFLSGHGALTTLENVVVGPLVALASFVCSIGNVPLAAALWKGGISFGGVVSFVFADLLTFPLLLVYRRYFGLRMTLRMLAVFWVAMSVAGLVAEALFSMAGLLPTARAALPVASDRVAGGATVVLDACFLVVLAGLYVLRRSRSRLGGGAGYATDPVCHMQVEIAHAPALTMYEGTRFYFCSDRCRDRFDADPARFASPERRAAGQHVAVPVMLTLPARSPADDAGAAVPHQRHEREEQTMATSIDPVCGMTVEHETAAAYRRHDGVDYYFCNQACAVAFDADTERYAAQR